MCAGHHNSSIVSTVLVDRSQSFANFDVGSYEFVNRWCEAVARAMRRSVGVSHRSSPSISHAIRSSDQLGMSRKPRNFNDVDSKFERGVGELHAKFGGGVLPWGRGAPGGFGVPGIPGCQGFLGGSGSCCNRSSGCRPSGVGPPGVSGARTLRGAGHRHRMITILIHIHVRST